MHAITQQFVRRVLNDFLIGVRRKIRAFALFVYAVLGVKPINGKPKLPEALPFQEFLLKYLANHWPEALKATLLPSVDRSLSLKTPLYSLSPWKP